MMSGRTRTADMLQSYDSGAMNASYDYQAQHQSFNAS
jgi:hypothetical protein